MTAIRHTESQPPDGMAASMTEAQSNYLLALETRHAALESFHAAKEAMRIARLDATRCYEEVSAAAKPLTAAEAERIELTLVLPSIRQAGAGSGDVATGAISSLNGESGADTPECPSCRCQVWVCQRLTTRKRRWLYRPDQTRPTTLGSDSKKSRVLSWRCARCHRQPSSLITLTRLEALPAPPNPNVLDPSAVHGED